MLNLLTKRWIMPLVSYNPVINLSYIVIEVYTTVGPVGLNE